MTKKLTKCAVPTIGNHLAVTVTHISSSVYLPLSVVVVFVL